jgi:putative membrane protein
MVQAYLYSKENISQIESILEDHSKYSKISTSQIRLKAQDNKSDVRLVVPDIHPGPYHPVGGSNITYRIYQTLRSSAMVMHSISDHAFNLPSAQQVDEYLKSLSTSRTIKEGMLCTEPVTVQINKARVIGLRFDKSALLFLSLSPHGMEDLPTHIKTSIEEYSKNRNFDTVMSVDCHNAMGPEISDADSQDILKAAKSCLDTIITKQGYPIEFGYVNSSSIDIKSPDLGMSGIGMLCLKINDKKYFFGWADSNNMENGIREFIVKHLAKHGYDLVEIATSDTHFSERLVRTKQGYYQLGVVTDRQKIADWYLQLAQKADATILPASFEILENQTKVKVMGPKIYEDFKKAIDNSLMLSKWFMIASTAMFLTSLFL